MPIKFIQLQPCPLVAFLNASDTSFQVTGFLYNDGVTPVDPADIGDICYGTLEPRTEREELISFTIDSVDEDGTATLTAVRGLSQKSPYGTGGASFAHQQGSNLVISNNPGLLNKFAVKDNDEVITGNWTFNTAPTTLSVTRASQSILGNVKLSSEPSTNLGVATITIANPAVISNVGHGLIEGDSVRFTTEGTLPTGITTAGEYFVIASGLTTDTFQLSETIGGAAIVTTGSQSGVHTLFRTTPVAVSPEDPVLPTQDEKDALSGITHPPSDSNKIPTSDDLSNPTYKPPQVQVFTASGTYTKPANLKYVIVEGVGGGGGGSTSSSGSATGGGGGGYFKKLISAAALGVSEVVTIGSAGASGAVGTAGGSTSFGAHATANGGAAGSFGPNAGGSATGGDINIQGQMSSEAISDGNQSSTSYDGGIGGSSMLGHGGAWGATSPTGYGSGGSGGSTDSRGIGAGTPGTAGILIITEHFV